MADLGRRKSGRNLTRRDSDGAGDRKPVTVDRYKHDVEQAHAMRRPLRQQDGGRSGNESKEPTLDDVFLGLKGLDEAETLRDRGELESALKLYELALELLIRVLGGNQEDMHGVDRGTLRARVQVALSAAESIKDTIKQKPKQRPAESSSNECPFRKSAFDSLSDAISTALLSPQKRKPTTRPTVIQPQRRTSNNSQTIPLQNQQGRRQTTLAQQTQPKSPSSQIRQTILDDLFVPSSELQKTTWNDIAGLKDVKQALQEAAILPLMRPDLFQGLRRPQNVLLWGPPGTGKTMLVRAVANESGCALFVCSASSLTSKWMGDSEKLVKNLFQIAREMAPSIIFIDEMDSVLSTRKSDGEHEASRRLKTEFMVQLDGIKATNSDQHVLVLACTNCPWDVDSAVLRRFPRRLLVPLPDSEARRGLLSHLLKKAGKHSISSRQLNDLVKRTDGFSCSDLTAIASEASFGPLRSLGDMKAIRNAREQDVRPIDFKDFERAISQATKSVTPEQLRRYQEWREQQSVK